MLETLADIGGKKREMYTDAEEREEAENPPLVTFSSAQSLPHRQLPRRAR
jgi:hypothetical protein